MKAASRTRVALVRTGIVLSATAAHCRRCSAVRCSPADRSDRARSMSWIHRDDWVDLVRWITTSSATGPFNATAPHPVTNKEFSRALGRALHRPSFMPAPAFALRLAVGEMADPLLLASQRVIPTRAQEAGVTFKYATIDEAMRAILQSRG
jgi:NAD dependent epimerase/dehydratase family enzyme